jgi:hypothetical protein
MLTKTGLIGTGVLESLRSTMSGEIVDGEWKIKKHSSGNYLFLEQVGTCLWFSDKTDFVEKFFDKLYGRQFSSMLCGGLGLGVIPYLVQSFCEKIDVVEISQGNIDLIQNNTDYLLPKVNIVQGDINTYQTFETYDVILLDVWTCDLENLTEEAEVLKTRYAPNLKAGGLIYVPIEEHYPARNK